MSNENEKLYFGYKTDKNRFNDSDLATPFVWKKKWQKENPKVKGKALKKLVASKLKTRKSQLKTEIENVKQLRKRREIEKRELEQMREEIKSLAQKEEHQLMEQKAMKYKQEKVRCGAVIRIREGRERNFDHIFKTALFSSKSKKQLVNELELNSLYKKLRKASKSKNSLSLLLEGIFELHSPAKLIISLSGKNTHHRLVRIQENVEKARKLGENDEFWENVERLIGFYLDKKDRGCVETKIFEEIDGKTISELDRLEGTVRQKLEEYDKGSKENDKLLDVEYWEDLISIIKMNKSKRVLQDWHERAVKTREELIQMFPLRKKTRKVNLTLSSKRTPTDKISPTAKEFKDQKEKQEISDNSITEEIFLSRLSQMRIAIIKEKYKEIKSIPPKTAKTKSLAQTLYEKERNRPMEENEDVFASAQMPSENSDYWWLDKFLPRKPLYFNRVKTGYDWSKYNRSHYDSENPPPKVVHGYKFNIFYPDLIDMDTSPSFSVEPLEDDSDYAIIRFKAGAPYEDIAFKIVNKEWNQDIRGGYRSAFSNGILQLIFNFRKFTYRR